MSAPFPYPFYNMTKAKLYRVTQYPLYMEVTKDKVKEKNKQGKKKILIHFLAMFWNDIVSTVLQI